MEDYLDAAAKEVSKTVSQGPLLERIRETLRDLRALEFEKTALEQRLVEVKAKMRQLSDQDLVQLFSEGQIADLTLEAEGNYPAVQAKRTPYYDARIPDDKAEEAFSWLQANGHGDIVKTTITVALGMKERKQATKVEGFLNKAGIDYSSKLAVHPSTLKSFVKAQSEAGVAFPKEAFGAFVGETVKLSIKKDK